MSSQMSKTSKNSLTNAAKRRNSDQLKPPQTPHILGSTGKLTPEPNYAEELVLYFYSELLNYVVVEYNGIPNTWSPDSDNEPTYDTDKLTTESVIEVKRSHSKNSKKSKNVTGVISRITARAAAGSQTQGQMLRETESQRQPPSVATNLTLMTSQSTQSTRKSKEHKPVKGREKKPSKETDMDELELTRNFSAHSLLLTLVNEELVDGVPMWLVKENMEREHVEIKFSTGMLYIGDLLRNRFEGKGTYKWPDGTIYEGEFTGGMITGYGKLTYNTLSYYSGTFVNCILDGRGMFSPLNSEMQYSGEWVNGVPHGDGQLKYQPNDTYMGQWHNGLKHGQGTRKYSSGSVYSGRWELGRQNGEGSMLFHNRDYYKGTWVNGKPNGYGEYTWATRLNDGLAFSIEKQYCGNFVHGLRDGYGVQIFGMEGSKIASLFDDNMKNGAGVIVCGDGTTIERKPLFLSDNPTRSRTSFTHPIIQHPAMSSQFRVGGRPSRGGSSTRMKSMMNIVLHETFPDKEIIERPSKIFETFPPIEASGLPIPIPVHATPLNLNLQYHVRKVAPSHHEHVAKHFHAGNAAKDAVRGLPNSQSFIRTAADNETRLLSHQIGLNYVYLNDVYVKYCTLNPLEKCCPQYHKPVMSRLHFWQFLRDIDVYAHNLSLYDVDMLLLDVPDIQIETEHDPFESIYFWQFMHCLLVLSHKIFMTAEFFEASKTTGTYRMLFHKFLSEIVRPNEGKFAGKCLFGMKDLLPIKAVHLLYKTVGEPHTARDLLTRICNRKGEQWHSCWIDKREVYDIAGTFKHYVINGGKFLYLREDNKDSWQLEDARILNKYADDPFYTDLKMFRVLGTKKVMQCIGKICPNVRVDENIVFIDYQITFLEFYEILLELGHELLLVKKKQEAEEVLALQSKIGVLPAQGSSTKKLFSTKGSTLSGRKKSSKKSTT